MELLMPRVKKDKVFLFDGSLGDQVWEAEPITRFRFKNPNGNNEYLKEQLNANKPTAGIVFEDNFYIGTNDGMIYSSGKNRKIQRIPEIFVDPELFIDEFPFKNDAEKRAFKKYKKEGNDGVDFKNIPLRDRIFEINEILKSVNAQDRNLGEFLLNSHWGIRGFVVNQSNAFSLPTLYDGHLLGITETITGKPISELAPQAFYQITPITAGFIPAGHPGVSTSRWKIKDGIESRVDVPCVDYRSLWDLTGQGRFAIDICPRNGSGDTAAKFATDVKSVTAIAQYNLDITEKVKTAEGIKKKETRIDLQPNKSLDKILIIDGQVIGHYGDGITNFTTGQSFNPPQGHVSSLSESGLCTVSRDGKTEVYNSLTLKPMDAFEGDYVFLNRAPQ